MSDAEPSSSAAGRVIGGKYRLERLLGSGGMGEVWLAEHLELGSSVAVKLMSPALLGDNAARARFRREARAAARLRSPHIVAVHDFGDDAGAPYMVMELLEGETLQEAQARQPFALGEVAVIAEQACEGLAAAHAQGIVHRDIKPSNLFLANVGGRSQLKLVDFGIARALLDSEESKVTRSGMIVGSPAFMSPEQASGAAATTASDLWALSAVLYWLIVRREPFSGRMMSETLYRVRTAQFAPPSELMSELPTALDTFFAQAFSLEPSARFRDAEQLSQAFRAALGTVAPPASGERRLLAGASLEARRPRRQRRLLYVAAFVAAALIFALIWRGQAASPAPRSAVPLADSAVSPATRKAASAVSAAPRADTSAAAAVTPSTVTTLSTTSAPSSLSAPPLASSTARVKRREPTERARAGSPATPTGALTQKLGSATSAPSGEAIDPIFGISVKPGQVDRAPGVDPASPRGRTDGK